MRRTAVARLLRRARHELRDRVAEGGLRLRRGRRRARRRRPGVRLRRRRSRAARPQARTTSCSLDRKDAFADDQVAKALLANALYEGKYPLVSALSRPVIAEAVAELALELGAEAVVHGCTGKGNDQLRFELAFKANYPGVNVIAPLRDRVWTRDEEIAYARGARHPGRGEGGVAVLDRRQPVRPRDRGRRARGPVDRAARGRVRADRGRRQPRRAPSEIVIGFEAGPARRARRRRAAARTSSSRELNGAPARTGSAGST